jgi:hypothetical protein
MGANKFTTASGDGACQQITLDTTGTYKLGQPVNGAVSSWILHVKGTGTPGSLVLKLAVTGSGLTDSDLKAPVYWAVDDESMVASGTAITTDNIYGVACDGCDLFLDFTEDTGSMAIYAYPILG